MCLRILNRNFIIQNILGQKPDTLVGRLHRTATHTFFRKEIIPLRKLAELALVLVLSRFLDLVLALDGHHGLI